MSESVKTPETKAPAKKTQAVTEAKAESVLYVGPTISGIAITGTVYTTIPEAAKAAKADAPMILNLFIPIREYGEAERMIREKRGYVYSAYAEAQKFKLERGGKAKKYTDTKSVKEESGYTSPFCYPLWPCDRVGEYILAKSAVAGAMIQYMASDNEDVPNQSPSNHLLGVGGQCLEDGTEVYLDQDQANTVNGYGVTTAINQNGYRLWGNYTGAYPASSDAKDIWFAVRRMFSWQGNNFIQTYFDEVDDPMNNVLVQSVVDSENIRCSAYAPKYWAGASIEYKSDDNPKTAILAGTMKFRQHIAPYTPAQEIVDIIDYDTDTLAAAVGGN